jgi:hypothetical protein
MSKVQGQVFRTSVRQFGGKDNVSIKLEDIDVYWDAGPNRWAGIAETGNVIEFEATEPQLKGKYKVGKITGPVKLAAPPPQSAAPVSAGGNLSGGARDASIQYQSSRKDALVFLELLVTAGALDISKAKQAAKVEILEAALDKYTASFYDDIGNLGAITRLETIDDPAAEPVADDEE